MSQTFEITQLAGSDSTRYNAFLSSGVRAHPDTLRMAPADITAAPFSTAVLSDGVTFVARGPGPEGDWFGVASVERERGRVKRSHIAWVLRMYVAREHAGRGIGRALLGACIECARSFAGVSKLNLTVAAHNAHAVGLYAAHGFRTFADEPDAFRDPEPRRELSMSLAL